MTNKDTFRLLVERLKLDIYIEVKFDTTIELDVANIPRPTTKSLSKNLIDTIRSFVD